MIGLTVHRSIRRIGSDGSDGFFLDLARPTEEWPPFPPADAVIICAAETSMAACDEKPAASRAINVDAADKIARRARDMGAFVVLPSTNMVFDGEVPRRSADAPPCPTTEYGRQKAEAEQLILALGDGGAVVRLGKVIPRDWPLMANWKRRLRGGEPIQPFFDMVMAPLSLAFTADILCRIAVAKQPGIFQASASEDISYADAGRHLARRLGLKEALVQPVSAFSTGLPVAAVPRHTTLDATRLSRELGLQPPSAIDALDSVVMQPASS
jgi:dTDP-4-dehydrorhamnose reductase